MPQILLPKPHDGQLQIMRQARRINVYVAGRRHYKTTHLARMAVIYGLIQGKRVLWGAPTMKQIDIGWREVHRMLNGVGKTYFQKMRIEFPSGGWIQFVSMDLPDNARGYTADAVLLDEFADIDPRGWVEIIRPMLMTTRGLAWLVGTPRGQDHFCAEFNKAQSDPEYAAWQAPTVGCRITADGNLIRVPHPLENPDVPFSEVVKMFQMMPRQIFEQEVLAEFIESGGQVFRDVDSCTTAPYPGPAMREPGKHYVMGMDVARYRDFTWMIILEMETRVMVDSLRFSDMSFDYQEKAFKQMFDKWRPAVVFVEPAQIGREMIERLQRENYPILAYQMNTFLKQQLIERLAFAFDYKLIQIQPIPQLLIELKSFRGKRLPSGVMTYGSPAGEEWHDDGVTALYCANAACCDYDTSPIVRVSTAEEVEVTYEYSCIYISAIEGQVSMAWVMTDGQTIHIRDVATVTGDPVKICQDVLVISPDVFATDENLYETYSETWTKMYNKNYATSQTFDLPKPKTRFRILNRDKDPEARLGQLQSLLAQNLITRHPGLESNPYIWMQLLVLNREQVSNAPLDALAGAIQAAITYGPIKQTSPLSIEPNRISRHSEAN